MAEIITFLLLVVFFVLGASIATIKYDEGRKSELSIFLWMLAGSISGFITFIFFTTMALKMDREDFLPAFIIGCVFSLLFSLGFISNCMNKKIFH